jgi:hypothetical protein
MNFCDQKSSATKFQPVLYYSFSVAQLMQTQNMISSCAATIVDNKAMNIQIAHK